MVGKPRIMLIFNLAGGDYQDWAEIICLLDSAKEVLYNLIIIQQYQHRQSNIGFPRLANVVVKKLLVHSLHTLHINYRPVIGRRDHVTISI